MFADGGAAVWCNKRVVGCSLYEVKAGTFFPSSKNVYASIYSMKVTKSFFVTVDDMIESDPVAVNTHATKYCYWFTKN